MLQAVIGFIMSGLYEQWVSRRDFTCSLGINMRFQTDDAHRCFRRTFVEPSSISIIIWCLKSIGCVWYLPELRRTWYATNDKKNDSWFRLAGPGNCLGLLASKSSPTAVRGQFYGLAAAIGKVGAFVGIWGRCPPLLEKYVPETVFLAFPPMIDGADILSYIHAQTDWLDSNSAFGGSKSLKGNTGPFWVGSGKHPVWLDIIYRHLMGLHFKVWRYWAPWSRFSLLNPCPMMVCLKKTV
jgi:hypothetical protein